MPRRKTKPADLDPMRRTFWDAWQASGLPLKDLSNEIGKNDSYLHKWLWQNNPQRGLHFNDALTLAARLDLAPDTLMNDEDRDVLAKVKGVDTQENCAAEKDTNPGGATTEIAGSLGTMEDDVYYRTAVEALTRLSPTMALKAYFEALDQNRSASTSGTARNTSP